MEIKPGYWYDVEDDPRVSQIKLIPSERWLESQDPQIKYFEVLGRGPNLKERILNLGSHSKEECLEFIKINFKIKTDYRILTNELSQLKEELQQDFIRLQKSTIKKDQEIALHIEYAINMLNILKDYEDRGLGDIKY